MAKLRVLSTLATFVLSSRAVCFYPDGITTDPGHRPCNSTLQQSACCDPMVKRFTLQLPTKANLHLAGLMYDKWAVSRPDRFCLSRLVYR